MGKRIQQTSKIPVLIRNFKKKIDNNKKLSYFGKRRSINTDWLKRIEVETQNQRRRSVLAELSTNPVVEAPKDSVRSAAKSKNFCDINCHVPITPRKTRSGKVFARMSQFFGSLNVKPIVSNSSSINLPVPNLPIVLLEDFVTTEEINRTIEEVPNLNEVSEPTPLFDFAEEMRKSLSPEVDNLDVAADKTVKTNEIDESQEFMTAVYCANSSVLEPLPVFAKFPGFKSNFEFSMTDDIADTSASLIPSVEEKLLETDSKTEENVEIAQKNVDTKVNVKIQNLTEPEIVDEELEIPSEVDTVRMLNPSVLDSEVLKPFMESDTFVETEKMGSEVLEKPVISEESFKNVRVPANEFSFSEDVNPPIRKSRRSTVYRKPVLKEKVDDFEQEAVEKQEDDNNVKMKRTQKRNSIFPRQAIKRISEMAEEAEASTSSEDILNQSPNLETDYQENDNAEIAVLPEAVDDQPKSKRYRKVVSKSQKKKEKAMSKKQLKKQTPSEQNEGAGNEVDDEPIAPVPYRFVSEGKVLVSMVLPKGKNGKRKKVPGIPQTIEIHPTLLKEPNASCIKKKEERYWTYKKYFRWADSKDEAKLEQVKEFNNEYNLRQSTYKKSFFNVPDEE